MIFQLVLTKTPQNQTKQDIIVSYLAVQPRAPSTAICTPVEALLSNSYAFKSAVGVTGNGWNSF